MKKYLLSAVMTSAILVSCSNSTTTPAPATRAPSAPSSADAATTSAPTTVLITTSVVAPPQSGSIVLRPVLQKLKDATAAPAELPAGAAVLTSKTGTAYLVGNVLSEGNIFADAAPVQQTDGTYALAATLREGSQGLDIFNIAAAGCVKKDASCPSGIMAVVVNGTFIGVVAVRGPLATTAVEVEEHLSEGDAASYVKLITGRS